MVDLLKKNFLRPLSFIDFYLFISAMSGLFLFGLAFIGEHNSPKFFEHYFFLKMFAVVSTFTFIRNFGRGEVLHSVNGIGPFLLGQMAFLWAHSLEQGNEYGLLLSFIPALTAFYIIETDLELDNIDKTNKAMIVLGFFAVLCTTFFINGESNYNAPRYYKLSALMTFFFWNMSIGGLSHFNIHRDNKKFILRLFRKNGHELSKIAGHSDKSTKDRYFFHDLINLTHGLNLFLGNKIAKNQSLTPQESMEVLQEVKTLESLVKDHYKLGHKNLVNSYNVVNFEFAKGAIFSMIENLLPSHLVDSSFIFEGNLSQEAPMDTKENNLVHYPTLYRVLNNLVKNISESKADRVEFVFNYDSLGLHVKIKNNIYKLDKNSQELAKDLSDIILDFRPEDQKGNGLGLESVTRLCEEKGGKFSFQITDGQWVSEIYLPFPHSHNQQLRKLA